MVARQARPPSAFPGRRRLAVYGEAGKVEPLPLSAFSPIVAAGERGRIDRASFLESLERDRSTAAAARQTIAVRGDRPLEPLGNCSRTKFQLEVYTDAPAARSTGSFVTLVCESTPSDDHPLPSLITEVEWTPNPSTQQKHATCNPQRQRRGSMPFSAAPAPKGARALRSSFSQPCSRPRPPHWSTLLLPQRRSRARSSLPPFAPIALSGPTARSSNSAHHFCAHSPVRAGNSTARSPSQAPAPTAANTPPAAPSPGASNSSSPRADGRRCAWYATGIPHFSRPLLARANSATSSLYRLLRGALSEWITFALSCLSSAFTSRVRPEKTALPRMPAVSFCSTNSSSTR